jgi:hypothetical protein
VKIVARLMAIPLLAAVLLLAPSSPAVAPVAASTTCYFETGYLVLYRDASYNQNNCLVEQVGNWPAAGFNRDVNLSSITQGVVPLFDCRNASGGTYWNDCVSSYILSAPCTYGFALYADYPASGLLYSAWGSQTRASMPIGWNDSASTLRLMHRTICPSSPAS